MSKKVVNRVAFVPEPGLIEFRKEEIFEQINDEVLIKIKAAAICGGDKKIFQGVHPFAPLPAALGHEFSGEVIAVGEQVKGIKPGERVTVEPSMFCGECNHCRRGKYNFCGNLTYFYREGKGGIADYIKVPASSVYPLPEGIDFEEGALIEPLAVTLHAWEKVQAGFGKSVCVLGCGPIGLLLVQLAKRAGCQEIFAVDKDEKKLRLAETLGADKGVGFSENITEELQDVSSRGGFDIVFEAVGLEIVLNLALDILLPAGELVNVGLYRDKVNLDINKLIKKEGFLRGTQGYCWNFADAIKLVENKRIDLASLITDRFNLGELSSVQEALQTAVNPEKHSVKVILTTK